MLTTHQRQLLQFEDERPRHYPSKSEDIRRRFNISTTRYYQLIRHLVRQPSAVAEFPQLCNRRFRLELLHSEGRRRTSALRRAW